MCAENGGFDCHDPDYGSYPEYMAANDVSLCIDKLVGDGYCDPENNNHYCGTFGHLRDITFATDKLAPFYYCCPPLKKFALCSIPVRSLGFWVSSQADSCSVTFLSIQTNRRN